MLQRVCVRVCVCVCVYTLRAWGGELLSSLYVELYSRKTAARTYTYTEEQRQTRSDTPETHVVENRRRVSDSKIGTEFRNVYPKHLRGG